METIPFPCRRPTPTGRLPLLLEVPLSYPGSKTSRDHDLHKRAHALHKLLAGTTSSGGEFQRQRERLPLGVSSISCPSGSPNKPRIPVTVMFRPLSCLVLCSPKKQNWDCFGCSPFFASLWGRDSHHPPAVTCFPCKSTQLQTHSRASNLDTRPCCQRSFSVTHTCLPHST